MRKPSFIFEEFFILFWLLRLASSEPTVTLRQGVVKGIRLYTEARVGISAYLGIPYASPPLGNLRFAAPEVHPGWGPEQTFQAKSFAPACLQPKEELEPMFGSTMVQNEDCLYLNVWTSDVVSYRNAPVVILFEGEGFVTGHPGRIPAQDLAAEGIVVISASYRLNVFGFLCFEDNEARGNVGLLDQYLVLVWVRENIGAFGGDTKSVTLMGHGAGATSIMYHMISPRPKGLFQRSILMSGSITSPWARSSHPSNASWAIAKSLGCLVSTQSKVVLSCLRSKSSEEILKAFETQYMNGNWTELPLPVIDTFLPDIEQYLPYDIDESLIKGKFLKVPILTGITSHEGAAIVSQWTDIFKQGYKQLYNFFTTSVIPSVVKKYNYSLHTSEEILTLLNWHYIESTQDGDINTLVSNLIEFYTDAVFRAPHWKQLSYLANISADPLNTVYAYSFDQGQLNFYKNELNISGSSHGTELAFLFGPTLLQKAKGLRFTPQEEKLSNTMKRLWGDFIRKGSLNPNPYGYGASWKRFDIKEDNYVIFQIDNNLPLVQSPMRNALPLSTADTIRKQNIRLWNKLLPKLNELSGKYLELKKVSPEMHLSSDAPYRNAMFTLLGFVVVLLCLLVVCVVLLKKNQLERERDMF